MKQCKYCQAELAENGTFCPACGRNNSEELPEEVLMETEVTEEQAAPAETRKATPGKIAMAVVAIVVLIALLIGLLAGGMTGKQPAEESVPTEETAAATEETVPATVPADGNPDDETCKGTYTVTDEEVMAAMQTVVATAGDHQLTNAELQVYYWMEIQAFLQNYGTYAYYFGLDYTQPLDTQVCGLAEGSTWQQFFLKNAIGTWQNYKSMAVEAEQAQFQLDEEKQEYVSNLADDLAKNAEANGFASAKEMLAYNVGAGADVEHYVNYMEDYFLGYQYYTSLCEQFDTSDPALEAYYQENEATFTENSITKEDKYVDVRHILIIPEGGTADDTGAITYSEEEWAAAQQKAQEILDQYLAGDKTEDSFAALANEHTADGNDVNYDGIPDGGLYTDVYKGQMVPEFEEWCFEESRTSGETGMVKTTCGWHIMYFVDSRPVWKSFAEEQLVMDLANDLLKQIVEKYPLSVDYSAIKLGAVNMGA